MSKKNTGANTGYAFMPARHPAANSLQANAPSEFAVTSHSQSLYASVKNQQIQYPMKKKLNLKN